MWKMFGGGKGSGGLEECKYGAIYKGKGNKINGITVRELV